MMQQLLCNITLLLACLVLGSDAKLRGIKGSRFEELKRKVSNPKGSKYIGKTLKDLGVSRRHLQDFDPNDNNIRNGALQFFSIYDESGPSIEGMGETAGFQGFIYKIEKLGWDISSISPEDVIGTLKGTCTVVGTSNDQLCTYEVLMYNTVDGSSFGTVIASGSITYRTADGGHLIVEAAGDDFAGRDGGILSIRYVQTGSVPILTGELFLS